MENNIKEKCECGSDLEGRPFGFCSTICDGCKEKKAHYYLRMLDGILKRRDDDAGTDRISYKKY